MGMAMRRRRWTPREREVMEALVNGPYSQSPLADLSEKLGISRERVRQARNTAIRKMLIRYFDLMKLESEAAYPDNPDDDERQRNLRLAFYDQIGETFDRYLKKGLCSGCIAAIFLQAALACYYGAYQICWEPEFEEEETLIVAMQKAIEARVGANDMEGLLANEVH